MGIQAWGSFGRSASAIALMAFFVSMSYAQDCGANLGEFCASYYNNKNLKGSPVLTRIESEIHHEWGEGSPAQEVRSNRFSARYKGFIQVAQGDYRFVVTADDGVRVRLDGQTIISAWVDQEPTEYTYEATLSAGIHDIEVDYYDTWGGATLIFDWYRLGAEPVCELPSEQFCASYYANTQLEGDPALVVLEPAIQNDWGSGGPYGLFSDDFSARWRGHFWFEAGLYRFETTADDGVRLYVDGALVIDAWVDQAPTAYAVTLDLSADNHEIVMEYYEKWGGAEARLNWEPVVVEEPNQAPTDLNLSQSFLEENRPAGAFIGNVLVSDPDSGDQHQLALVAGPGGDDNSRFRLEAGGLYALVAFDYEADAALSIRVRAEDGAGGVLEKALAITVLNVNENPTALSLIQNDLPADAPIGTDAGAFAAADPDTGEAFRFALVAGVGDTHNGLFSIDGGHLLTSASLAQFAGSELQLRARVTDAGGGHLDAALTLTVGAGAPPPPPTDDPHRSPLGINISALNYWAREWPLVDVMKSAGGWYTQTWNQWDTGEQNLLDLDEDGWVRSLPDENDPNTTFRSVAALMLFGSGGYHPAGRYIVLYEGEGEIQYFHDAVYNQELSQPGRHVLDLNSPSDSGILMRIMSTDPQGTGNYLRNIRVIMPGAYCGGDRFAYCAGDGSCGNQGCIPFEDAYQTYRFHPLFLQNLRDYRAIRFMDFQNTNLVEITGWDERTRLGHFSWSRQAGGPYEIAVELCNALGADGWFNMPHKADDDHITRFAQLVRDNLNPDLKVYVEYGNEIWNTAFSAGNWVQEQAVAQWPQSSEDPYVKRMNWYGKRAAETAAIWKQVWGGESARVIAVMGGFVANDWVSAIALDCPMWSAENGGTPCSEMVDAVAIAPYFGGYLGDQGFADEIAGWMIDADGGLNKLFQELQQGGLLYDPNHFPEWERAPQYGAVSQTRDFITRHFDLASEKGLDLVSYEGGQHLVGVGTQQGNTALTNLFIAANRDPRMYQVYQDALATWRDNGGQLFTQWLSVGAYSQWGSWGAKEYQTQENAPKADALTDFIADNPCWWAGCERFVDR